MIDYYLRLVDLPRSVEGVSVPNNDGSFDIYINALLSPARRQEILEHELNHIRQDGGDNIGGHASIILLQSALPIELQGGQVRQHIKAAVRGQALENGMGGIGLNHMGAGALVVHGFSPFCRGCSGVTRI